VYGHGYAKARKGAVRTRFERSLFLGYNSCRFFTVPMPDPLELMAKSWLRILVQSGHGKELLLLEMRVSNREKFD
jgi:hypothetical protein